jgi:ABC-type sugar transport system ATPase subunit
MAGVILKNVKKHFGALEVIKGVDIDIAPGEFCVFVGPSGCGKSTLLRMIAGLEEITGGTLSIGGRRVNDLDPKDRGAAMVFQTYALYPHMTVERNMGFGLRMNGMPKDQVAARVAKAAKILQLGDYLQRKPKALSGGQRQRVAIGRAIVREPEVFLFDEPLSNLDAELRVATRLEIAKLHAQLDGATMIYVTHDQVEAMTLADKIVVLRDGRVEQIGAPMELYSDPANLFVAGFIGSPRMNLIPVTSDEAGVVLPDGTKIAMTAAQGTRTLGLRADALTLDPAGPIGGDVTVIEMLGDAAYAYIRLPWDQEIVVRTDPQTSIRQGDRLRLQLSGKAHLFDASGLSLQRNRPE